MPERKLQIELVPSPLWGKSLSSTLPRKEWDRVRKSVYARQGHSCGICGAQGILYCHEIWHYDDHEYIQTLTGFIAICSKCNSCTHLGKAQLLAKEGKIDMEALIGHYMQVNGCSLSDFKQDKRQAFEQWRERSDHAWTTAIGDYNRFLSPE